MKPISNDFIPVTAAYCCVMTKDFIITTWDYGRCVGRRRLKPISVAQMDAIIFSLFEMEYTA